MKRFRTAALSALLLFVASAAFPQGGYGGPRRPEQVNKAALDRLVAAEKKADAAFAKRPKDPSAKKAYVEAANRHGLAAMVTDALDRREKYRVALKDFRRVLKVDPKNAVAKENADLIVSIYKSLGRPVPG